MQIDLFASRFIKKLDLFVSWGPDSEAFAVNAFSLDWSLLNLNIYAFPPFSLIDRVLDKIIRERPNILLITPYWPTQPWFPTLLTLVKGQPIRLPVIQ